MARLKPVFMKVPALFHVISMDNFPDVLEYNPEYWGYMDSCTELTGTCSHDEIDITWTLWTLSPLA